MNKLAKALRLCKEILRISNSQLTDDEKEQILSTTYYEELNELLVVSDYVKSAWERSKKDSKHFNLLFSQHAEELIERLTSVDGLKDMG